MTVVVGVLYSDGVVIGTDSAATFGYGRTRTVEQLTDKLFVHGDVIVAGTGAVGLGQRFCQITRHAWEAKLFRDSPYDIVKQLSRKGQDDFAQTSAPIGQYGALVAFPCEKQAYLCEFQQDDFQPEFKDERLWYVSLGSAQPITDPFLALMREVFWREGRPRVEDAIFVVTWAIEHAIKVNPGGVNGPTKIAVLEAETKSRLAARLLDDEEIDMHRQNVADALEHLRGFRNRHQVASSGVPDLPEVPQDGTRPGRHPGT